LETSEVRNLIHVQARSVSSHPCSINPIAPKEIILKAKFVIASDHGVHLLQKSDQRWTLAQSSLEDHRFTAVACKGDAILAGARDGLFLSTDRGRHWQQVSQGLTHPHIRALLFHPERPQLAYAGTEPAAIFVSEDGGYHWQERPHVAKLRDKYDWSLPYSPNAGCVRGFAFQKQRGYAAVEQGGLLRSDDHGGSWELVRPPQGEDGDDLPWIHIDVHSVLIHPTSFDHLYAPTGGGFYRTLDGGQSWEQLHHDYCRAVWVEAEREDHIILGPADGPDRNGRIEESSDGGAFWSRRMEGLAAVWQEHMVAQFLEYDEHLFAVLSNGALITAPLDSLNWNTILDSSQAVREIALLR